MLSMRNATVSTSSSRLGELCASVFQTFLYDDSFQWAENFICDEVAGEELWEEVVAAARMLANSTEAEVLVKP